MENEPEVIRQQMEETRTSLAEKLENLEEQVSAKIQGTTDSVAETVESVKEAVESTVNTVSNTVDRTVESVKHTFDVRRQFEERPWVMFGGAVVVGFVGGKLLNRMAPPHQTNGYRPEPNYQPAAPTYQSAQPTYNQQPAAPSKPGWGAEVVETLKPALSKLSQLAIGVTTGIIGEMVREQLPEALQKDVGDVLDDITRSLGGKPLHGFMAHEATDHRFDDAEATTHQVP